MESLLEPPIELEPDEVKTFGDEVLPFFAASEPAESVTDALAPEPEWEGGAPEPEPDWTGDAAATPADYDAWTMDSSAVEESREVAPAAAELSASQPDPMPASAGEESVSGEVVTETLADLYLAQGFAERAADMYRALLRMRPGDARLLAKLSDSESALQPEPSEDAGEVWLRGVESAWTGGSGATGTETTPYTWAEREEREEGVAIRAYLRDLITWGTGESETEHIAPEPAPELEPEAETAFEEMPWQQYVDEAVAPAEPEPWAFEATSDAPAVEADAVESGSNVDPWSMTAEPMLDEDWGSEQPEPWAIETPADPWLAPEPSGIEAPAPPPARQPSGNPIQDAFNDWFDQPVEPAFNKSTPELAAPPSPTQEPALVSEETADAADDEDEDLEMFRAWLQSLKK